MHRPPQTVCSQSSWPPELLKPGKGTKRTPNQVCALVADISRYPEDILPLASLTLCGASSGRGDVNSRESVECDRGGDECFLSG